MGLYSRNSSSLISICTWNFGVIISKSYNKLNNSNFRKELSSYDTVFLSETHTGSDTRIYIEGFQHVQICRPISCNNRYYHSGLALLIRKTLSNGIKILNQRTNGPVNAHLIYWPSKAQNIQNLENIW